MSLWTPSGEHPVDRGGRASSGPRPTGAERPAAPPIGPEAPAPEDLSPEEREQVEAYARQVEEARQRLLEMPAGPVIGQQALQFYELAALHLSQPEPRLEDARTAIDALAAVVDSLGTRLGEAHEPLTQALHQLRLAFVEASGSGSSGADRPGPDTG
jgi:hypothetical protein